MSSDPQRPDDDDLEEFLSGKSPLSGAWREASRESAPSGLDAPILAAARAAAQPRTAPRPQRWLRPMAVAASVGLSFSVLFNVMRDPAGRQQVERTMAPTASLSDRDVDEAGAPPPAPEARVLEEHEDRAEAAREIPGADASDRRSEAKAKVAAPES